MTKDTTKEAAVAADILLSMFGLMRSRTAFAPAFAASSRRCWRRSWRLLWRVRAVGGARRTETRRPRLLSAAIATVAASAP